MNQSSVQQTLATLPIAAVRYFDSIGSTNDEALAWAAHGAADLSIVVADEQTAGRGRLGRKWFTPRGAALAMSVILRPSSRLWPARTVGLAALSVADSLRTLGLAPRIKWPNDILLNSKKVCGILIETIWSGSDIDSLVVGIGLNVLRGSLPPQDSLQYPATTLEHELGAAAARESLIEAILSALIARREQMRSDHFMQDWESLLAFRGEQVQVSAADERVMRGELLGLDEDGSLRLRDEHGDVLSVHVGDVSLRPSA